MTTQELQLPSASDYWTGDGRYDLGDSPSSSMSFNMDTTPKRETQCISRNNI